MHTDKTKLHDCGATHSSAFGLHVAIHKGTPSSETMEESKWLYKLSWLLTSIDVTPTVKVPNRGVIALLLTRAHVVHGE